MDDWDLETPKAKGAGPSGGGAPHGAAASSAVPESARPDAGSAAGLVAGTATDQRKAAAGDAGTLQVAPARRSTLVRVLPVVAGAVLLLLIGSLAGFFIARSQHTAVSADLVEARQQVAVVEKALTASEERNWEYYRENEALQTQIDALRSGENGAGPGATTPTTAPGGRATYTDGTFLVGEDIAPGEYDGVLTGQVGYWARLRGTDGQIGAIVANGLVTGPFVLTINTSDVAVELRGVTITSR